VQGRHGGLLLTEIVDIGLNVAAGLDYMHRRGLYHGDLHRYRKEVDKHTNQTDSKGLLLQRLIGAQFKPPRTYLCYRDRHLKSWPLFLFLCLAVATFCWAWCPRSATSASPRN
jgi:hypothetical protein